MSKFKTVTFTILGIVAFGVVAWATIPYWSQGSAVVEVTGTTTKRQSGKDQYLVFTTTGTYKNTDSLHYLKFDSSDLQGKLNRPGRYRINYYGFRVPVLSMYKNITKAETIA